MKRGQKNPRASRNWIRCDYWKRTELTIAEAADLAGVAVSTIDDWLSFGYVLRANNVGPFRVDHESLRRWLRTGHPQGCCLRRKGGRS